MLVGLGWAHTSVCHVISVVYFVLVYIYSINGCASPRGKGRIADEDSAPCRVQCLESKRSGL